MTQPSGSALLSSSRSPVTACLVGMICLAVTLGVGRFASTPLLPLMARDGVLAPEAGAWIAASNYIGYLLGALSAARIRATPQMLLRVSLVGVAALTAAMGSTGSVAVWTALRFSAGILSAWALVATSAWTLSRLAQARRSDLSGVVYAGVGAGIALVGLFCIVLAGPGVSSSALWLGLGALTTVLIIAPLALLDGAPVASAVASPPPSGKAEAGRADTGIVVCYGMLGFGYILPATFLPVLARQLVDDPRVFGLAWPVFGAAAALSTVIAARTILHRHRRRSWAICHLAMASGVVLPSLWLSQVSIAIAALLVGSTFMVVTMIGMVEARARSVGDPTPLLGKMTAAFAAGQLAGPLMSGMLGLLPYGHAAALNVALQVAAAALVVSALYLLWSTAGNREARAG